MLNLSLFEVEHVGRRTLDTSCTSHSENFSFPFTKADLAPAIKRQTPPSMEISVNAEEEELKTRYRSTTKLLKRNLLRNAYSQQLNSAVDDAKRTLLKASLGSSVLEASTTRIAQLIDVADNIAKGNEMREEPIKGKLEERMCLFETEEDKREEQYREQVNRIISAWKDENGMAHIVNQLPRANTFGKRITSIVARLQFREWAIEEGEKETSNALDVLQQRQNNLQSELNELCLTRTKVEADIEEKSQRLQICQNRLLHKKDRRMELEKTFDEAEPDDASLQKEIDAITLDVARFMIRKEHCHSQLSERSCCVLSSIMKYDEIIKRCNADIQDASLEGERLRKEIEENRTENDLVVRGNEVEGKLNEIRMKIGRLKERLSSLDTSLGDDRGKPVNHLRGEVMELKEAIAKTTNEMIQTRNMVAGLDNKLVFIQERIQAVDIEEENKKLAAEKTAVGEMRKKRDTLKAVALELATRRGRSGNDALAFTTSDVTAGLSTPIRLIYRCRGNSCSPRCLCSPLNFADEFKGIDKQGATSILLRKANSNVPLIDGQQTSSPSPLKSVRVDPVVICSHIDKQSKKISGDGSEKHSEFPIQSLPVQDVYSRVASWLRNTMISQKMYGVASSRDVSPFPGDA